MSGAMAALILVTHVLDAVTLPLQVVSAQEVELEELLRAGLLEPGETVLLVHFEDPDSPTDAGRLVSDRRVVSWWGGALQGFARHEEITEVVLAEEGGPLANGLVIVRTEDGDELQLRTSPDAEGDAEFVELVRVLAGSGR